MNILKKQKDKENFLKCFTKLTDDDILTFHLFRCPVTICEAMVSENSEEDFNELEYMVLRLYNAGFHSAELIDKLLGINAKSLIEKTLHAEKYVNRHIDEESGKLTQKGLETLKCNEELISKIMAKKDLNDEEISLKNRLTYETPRLMQIESLTATIMPSYIDLDESKLAKIADEYGEIEDHIIPIKETKLTKILMEDIKKRIDEYKLSETIEKKIIRFNDIHPRSVYYRPAYFVELKGCPYPIILFTYRRNYKEDFLNAPVSIAKSNNKPLSKYGLKIDVPICPDDGFNRLIEIAKNYHNKRDDKSAEIEVKSDD